MNLEAQKLQLIEKIITSNNASTLERISQLLQQTTKTTNTKPTENLAATSSGAEITSSSTRIDQLDELIVKNMPTPEKSLSIEEIRALVANTEKALQAGNNNTDAIFKAITDNDLK